MTDNELIRILPGTTRAGVFASPLTAAMDEFGIKMLLQRAAFIANFGHETGGLALFSENLNYSAGRMMQVWPKRFPTEDSTRGYASNPVALANKVYANRMGNGDEASGDGWRFRGAGGFQLTGRNNHTDCAMYFKMKVGDVGDWLRTPTGACRSAAWYYTTSGLHKIDNFDHICDLVNLGRKTDTAGDSIGFKDRFAIYNRALDVLA